MMDVSLLRLKNDEHVSDEIEDEERTLLRYNMFLMRLKMRSHISLVTNTSLMRMVLLLR